MVKTTPRALARLRKLCLVLPEAQEVEAWGEPTFRVRKKMFAMYAGSSQHGVGRNSVWIKSTAADQDFLVRSNADRFFVPPYMGPSGWIGVYLDGDVDWAEVDELLDDGYRLIAPKRMLKAALTAPASPPSASRSGRA